jgi:HK97 gp10 family phage protein
VAIELRGFDDLKDDLINMAAHLEQGPGVNRALQAGAVPIEEQMLHNASTDPAIITGDLHGSIRTGSVRKKRSGGKRITIGVHHKDKGAYYANPVEFGHGGPAPAPAHPFVRPAFDTRADDAFDEMKRVLREEISKI